MKQTAVEWLQQQYNQCPKYEEQIYEQDWEQAKEIEKQQLEEVWKASEQNMRSQFSSSHYKNVTFEDWLEKNK